MIKTSAELPKYEARKPRPFEIVGAQERDSLGTEKWREYLTFERLSETWSPPQGSPYERFVKTKTMEGVEAYAASLQPRFEEGDEISAKEIRNLIGNPYLKEGDTAVILDSGGAHSVAMAVELAKVGYQPIVMLDGVLHPEGSVSAHQGLAALLYFSAKMEQLKREGAFGPNSPPVFIMNRHRSKQLLLPSMVDNYYSFSGTDLPSANELKGIKRIVYVNEGDEAGRFSPEFQSIERVREDLRPTVENWERKGIEVMYTGIAPLTEEEKEYYERELKELDKLQEEERFYENEEVF